MNFRKYLLMGMMYIHLTMIFLFILKNDLYMNIMVVLQILEIFYLIKVIGESGTWIALILVHDSSNLVLLLGLKIKDIFNILDVVYITRFIRKYGTWIIVEPCIPTITDNIGD